MSFCYEPLRKLGGIGRVSVLLDASEKNLDSDILEQHYLVWKIWKVAKLGKNFIPKLLLEF